MISKLRRLIVAYYDLVSAMIELSSLPPDGYDEDLFIAEARIARAKKQAAKP